MTKLFSTVLHESAALYRFVDSVTRRCSEIHEYPVYTKTSQKFFQDLERLGRETKVFLENFPSSVRKHAETASSKRRKLHTLRLSWEVLHEYLQPVLDADTLHLPTPLLSAIQDEINKIDGLRELDFTIFHSDEVNYLQVPSGIVKETADSVAELIGGTKLPSAVGLIGMPYSQSSAFFLNCLLTHEMAHVAYQEGYGADASSEIDRALEAIVHQAGGLSDREVALSREILERWVEEVFCDAFAICLIGPAYSFALIELTGATLLAHSPLLMLDPFHSFMEYHPAEVARFRTHLRLLKKLGWWAELEDIPSCHIEVLRTAEARSSNLRIETEVPEQIGEAKFIDAFFRLCDWLIGFLTKEVPFPRSVIAEYRRQSKAISEYLQQAVVPSTIVVNGKVESPKPVVLINAVYRFYLEGIPNLIANVEGGTLTSVKAHSEFVEQLELWSLKALEDCRLLMNPEAADGGSS